MTSVTEELNFELYLIWVNFSLINIASDFYIDNAILEVLQNSEQSKFSGFY